MVEHAVTHLPDGCVESHDGGGLGDAARGVSPSNGLRPGVEPRSVDDGGVDGFRFVIGFFELYLTDVNV